MRTFSILFLGLLLTPPAWSRVTISCDFADPAMMGKPMEYHWDIYNRISPMRNCNPTGNPNGGICVVRPLGGKSAGGRMLIDEDAYSDKLTEALKAAGVFSRVSLTSDFDGKPDFVAVVEKQVHGSAVIPALTFLTAGVVPTVAEEENGVVFSLAPSSRKSQKTMVDASYRGTSTLGWAALGIRVLPDYTGTEPEQSERFRKMLAYRTLSALKGKSP
jgi:hypothetical protein